MNSVIRAKIENYEMCTNKSTKFINVAYAIESIMIYYSTIYFCHTRYYGYTNRDIAETIMTRYHNRGPLTSSWCILLTQSIDLLSQKQNIKFSKLPESMENFIIATYKYFFPGKTQKDFSFKTFCDCFSKFKNKVCSHGGGINEKFDFDLMYEFEQKEFHKVPYDLMDFLSQNDESVLVSIESIVPKEYSSIVNCITLSRDINNSFSVEVNSFDMDIYTDQAYCYFEKDKKYITTKPFFIIKDALVRYYNGINQKQNPEYQNFHNQTLIEVKSNAGAFKKLISDDIDSYSFSEIPLKIQYHNKTYHNLPSPSYRQFIGRKELLARIINALLNRRLFIISISGVGGVGKSAAAVKVANEILFSQKIKFSFMIWVSAKKTYLTEKGIITETQSFETLNQLLDLILKITGFVEGRDYTFSKKKAYVLDILSLDSFLIIVDNFETLENPQTFIDFFEEIGDKSLDTKIIITSRRQLGTSEKIIDIREMGEDEYEDYIDYLSDRYQLPFVISKKMRYKLHSFTGGLPLATEFILSRTKKIDDLQKTINKIEEDSISKDSILDFSYNESFCLLTHNDKKVLYSITLVEGAKLSILTYVTQLDEFDVEESLTHLEKLSFINKNYEKDDIEYSVLPLTKIFVEKMIKDTDVKNEVSARFDEYNNIMQQVGFDTSVYDITLTSDSIGVKYAKAGYIQARDQKFRESEENFNSAISINPDDAEIWYLWARASFDSSNILRRNYFEKAARLAKNDLREKVLFDYGKALISLKFYFESSKAFLEVTRINPRNISALHYLGKSYFEYASELFYKGVRKSEIRKYYELSQEAFIRSFYNDPQTEIEKRHNVVNCYYMARLLKHIGQYDDSKKYAEQGLSYQPGNSRLLDLLDKLEQIRNDNKAG